MDEAEGRPRLMLVEDDTELGPLVATMLAADYDVDLVQDGAEGLDAALTGVHAAIVLDRRLPTRDGIAVLRALRAAGLRTPVVLLTALGSVRDRVEGLDAGADDYLPKPFDADELLARLRAARRSVAMLADEGRRLPVGAWDLYPQSRALYSPYGGRTILTERECDLLALLASHPRRTFTRAEILEEVFAASDTAGTVDTYVHYVRRKTEPALIQTVRSRGYRLGQP
jgi:two-component system response regulator QseB